MTELINDYILHYRKIHRIAFELDIISYIKISEAVSMKCCLCGCEFDGFGNNPWPLVDRTDYDSRCCNTCDEAYVIPARIQIHTDAMSPEEPVVPWNSTIAIFHAEADPAPTKIIKATIITVKVIPIIVDPIPLPSLYIT